MFCKHTQSSWSSTSVPLPYKRKASGTVIAVDAAHHCCGCRDFCGPPIHRLLLEWAVASEIVLPPHQVRGAAHCRWAIRTELTVSADTAWWVWWAMLLCSHTAHWFLRPWLTLGPCPCILGNAVSKRWWAQVQQDCFCAEFQVQRWTFSSLHCRNAYMAEHWWGRTRREAQGKRYTVAVQGSQSWKQRCQYSLAGHQFGLELAVTFTLPDASIWRTSWSFRSAFYTFYKLFITGQAVWCQG